MFEIGARAGSARAGVLHLAHGDVRTPAFVPLASHATVRSLQGDEVEALGYEMVLGNTFHLFLNPGHERIAALGGLHEFMDWPRPIITDSGGFQVFSLGHGTVADEIKGRRAEAGRHSRILEIGEEGVRFRSYVDGSEHFMGPETSMQVQNALGSDIALAFDECTPFHAERDYTERSMRRTHRWLERCVEWQAEHAPPGQVLYGIVQGGVYDDLRHESAEAVAGAGTPGIAIGGSLGADKQQMREVVGWTIASLPGDRPRHLLGIGDVDDIVWAVELGIDTFDCATPTRLARHGTALVPDPGRRWRIDLIKAEHADSREPIQADCDCYACTHHTRAYLHYLARSKELTAVRLLTLHNLTFMKTLMERLRAAIEADRYAEEADAILG
ncbi:MAG TPA: tRNA guanosine(34) transglycosylase Tgt [Thermoleophilaceae bacterium]|nr:tRNA guanosine(34) transglycosylase Tgt [Thermoleophilaceae bacterium]